MRILITGYSGFAGKHLIEYLSSDKNHVFFGVDLKKAITGPDIGDSELIEQRADLSDKKEAGKIIRKFKPDQIYHLAAQSSVSYSWKDPVGTFRSNVFGGINLLESIREASPGTGMLVICTAEEYGEIKDGRAIIESDKIYPENPYAVSKTAMDFISTIYHRAYGLNIMVARSFNHIGPGQSEGFVCSDFARQISLIEAGLQKPVIHVGNLGSSRDFLDVRDVTRAYWHIMNKGNPGDVYNVCSGRSVMISALLDMLISLSSEDNIEVRVDKNKSRPIDIAEIFGDNSKLVAATGWQPEYRLETSLSDTLDWWREKTNKRKGN